MVGRALHENSKKKKGGVEKGGTRLAYKGSRKREKSKGKIGGEQVSPC